MGLTAAGTAARILGTISVHNVSPAWAVIILLVMGKAKTPVRVWSRRLGFRLIRVWSRGSEEVEPTAALGFCQIYTTQEGGLLRGGAMARKENMSEIESPEIYSPWNAFDAAESCGRIIFPAPCIEA
jgi:hypothetical protein